MVWEQAMEAYSAALAIHPGDIRAFYFRARAAKSTSRSSAHISPFAELDHPNPRGRFPWIGEALALSLVPADQASACGSTGMKTLPRFTGATLAHADLPSWVPTPHLT